MAARTKNLFRTISNKARVSGYFVTFLRDDHAKIVTTTFSDEVMKAKISLITLGVVDVNKAKTFYNGLGFPHLTGDGDDFVMYDLEGTKLALFPRERLAEDAGTMGGGEGFSGITLAHNVASKELVDAVIAEAVALGATVAKSAHDTFWGGYSGYFTDLDGYFWEVAWNPFTDLT